ncbi:hypothetical protein MRX96_003988 [Rhipicephalus microplus]
MAIVGVVSPAARFPFSGLYRGVGFMPQGSRPPSRTLVRPVFPRFHTADKAGPWCFSVMRRVAPSGHHSRSSPLGMDFRRSQTGGACRRHNEGQTARIPRLGNKRRHLLPSPDTVPVPRGPPRVTQALI